MKLIAIILVAISYYYTNAFSPTAYTQSITRIPCPRSTSITSLSAASAAAASPNEPTTSTPTDKMQQKALTKQQKRLQQIRKEGGPLAFNTKYGALNPFAIYYGLVSIGLGLIWFVLLTLSQLFYKLTGGRFDTKRRLPVFFSHCWGTLLMAFTGCFPKIENANIVKEFHKSGRKAMFVSNHNSWMDIPFLGHAIGWINYKFVAKKELEKVPILGKAIKVAKNVLVDRSNRKSQLLTLKSGMKWLDVSIDPFVLMIIICIFISCSHLVYIIIL